MIIKANDRDLPHMFLRGARAPSGGVAEDGAGVTSEPVGALVPFEESCAWLIRR